ncbi:host specificity protein J [Stutzerimonas kunmingensis]|uniref:host specificity protein J n=1 Tax=Stutzerimonas kunmingensis TaxID=1211807 RepID=UPI001F346483|nr:phage tail protein [Stutzerimonas kunmingensis]UIP34265.1 phage tail protein [Stutzerimonas kunmingensis]
MSAAAAIHGRKGGEKKPRTPREAPDSVQSTAYAKLLIALGEGEYAGNAAGTLDGRDIYLAGTPLIGPDGTENFPGVRWEFRPGTPHQEHIAGLPAVENEIGVGVELRSGTPWVRAITNPQLSAVRLRLSWPALQQQKDNGDVVGYRIDYAIDVATDGGSWQEVSTYTVNGKTTTKYERTHRIDLPAGSAWQARVRRLTPNQDGNKVADTMRVEAITEVIDAKLRYPNTALLYVEFDAAQFDSIPQVAVETRGRVIRVPSNYDPATRAYVGLWDGTFKWAWTDNPAWVWYDVVLAKRFGLGRRITADQVDKWALYRIAQYCDELVPDGQGGQEPRFTCNVYIQSQAEAWTVLRDLAAIFRGMTYWDGTQMVAEADMPRPVDYVYSRANGVVGGFSYAGGQQKNRYSMALVSYDEPANAYQSDVEPVADNALVRRYGVNKQDITAIGCTRRSEANRRGRWLLLTNAADRMVTFRVGLDGVLARPGWVIGVADELLAGRPLGGRISLVSGRQITLDRDAQVQVGDRLVLNLPSGVAEGRTVQSVTGRTVTVTTEYSETPRAQSVWALDAADLAIQLYRVTRVSRPEAGVFEIVGVQYDPSKHGAVDTGARIEQRPVSVVPAGVQAPPTGVILESFSYVDQGLAITTLRAQWEAAAGAVAYEAEWRKDDGQWLAVPRTSALGFEVPGIYAGRYLVRVRAVNPIGVASLAAYSAETQLNGKEGAPPALASLTTTPELFGIGLAWAFPAEGAADTQRTEIEYNTSPSAQGVMHLGDYAYPHNRHTMAGLAAGATFHFRGRLVDRSGNVGPWSAWVMGQASVDATKILDAIAGKISETELGQHLQDRLDLIDGSGPGSVNERLQQVADVLAYDPAKTYAAGETVRAGQRLYQATAPVPAETPPPNATYWLDIGQAVQAANALAGQVSQNAAAIEQTEQGLQAQAERLDGVFAQVNPPLAGDAGWSAGSTAVLAGVWSEQSARASEDMALAVRIDSVTAQVGQNAAAITAEQTARADAISAMAQRIDTVEAELGEDLAATVQQTSEAVASLDGQLRAMYSVKLGVTSNGQYYAAGMGIGIENTPEGMQSQVLFQADRFAVINVANGQITTPFVIQGGQVFINSAVIGDGTIDMAKIATALQSTDYVAGQQGWRLDKAGNFEINGSVAGQGRMQLTNRALKFWDGNDVLRIQAGDLTA